jgi:PhoH-like ATPase
MSARSAGSWTNLIAGASKDEIDRGCRCPACQQLGNRSAVGCFSKFAPLRPEPPANAAGQHPGQRYSGHGADPATGPSRRQVTLVSKDINLRIKAAILGMHAEDYYNDQALDDVNLLYSGTCTTCRLISGTATARSWIRGRTAVAPFIGYSGPDVIANWHPNQGLYSS